MGKEREEMMRKVKRPETKKRGEKTGGKERKERKEKGRRGKE